MEASPLKGLGLKSPMVGGGAKWCVWGVCVRGLSLPVSSLPVCCWVMEGVKERDAPRTVRLQWRNLMAHPPSSTSTDVNVVIGASRGLGAAIAAELARRDPACPVLGTVRSATDNPAPPGVTLVPGIDIGSDDCVPALRSAVGDRFFIRTLIISAAAMTKDGGAGGLDAAGLAAVADQFQVNALGPVRVAAALAGRVRPGGHVVLVASRTGLPSRLVGAGTGGMVAYRASKAAALAVGAILAHELGPRGVAVASIHPGTIETDMYAAWHGTGVAGGGGGGGGDSGGGGGSGGETTTTTAATAAAAAIAPRTHAPVSPAVAAARLLDVVERCVVLEATGKVWDEEGREMAYG
jgi:NAD(P)-dependent dehydrogenase (short-subunit alcohol dehydrogenase family)